METTNDINNILAIQGNSCPHLSEQRIGFIVYRLTLYYTKNFRFTQNSKHLQTKKSEVAKLVKLDSALAENTAGIGIFSFSHTAF